MKKDIWIALPSLASTAHEAVRRVCNARGGSNFLVIDATAGNGYDTLFLTEITHDPRQVIAFDVQPLALEQTRLRLADAGFLPDSVPFPRLILDGHENMAKHIANLPDGSLPVAAILFNLGFLPGSDKSIRTSTATTLAALEASIQILAPHGILTIHLYTGHPGGKEEADAILTLTHHLSRDQWRILLLSEHNKTRNQEHLLLMEKA